MPRPRRTPIIGGITGAVGGFFAGLFNGRSLASADASLVREAKVFAGRVEDIARMVSEAATILTRLCDLAVPSPAISMLVAERASDCIDRFLEERSEFSPPGQIELVPCSYCGGTSPYGAHCQNCAAPLAPSHRK